MSFSITYLLPYVEPLAICLLMLAFAFIGWWCANLEERIVTLEGATSAGPRPPVPDEGLWHGWTTQPAADTHWWEVNSGGQYACHKCNALDESRIVQRGAPPPPVDFGTGESGHQAYHEYYGTTCPGDRGCLFQLYHTGK